MAEPVVNVTMYPAHEKPQTQDCQYSKTKEPPTILRSMSAALRQSKEIAHTFGPNDTKIGHRWRERA